MEKIKIVHTEEELLKFSDGSEIYSQHHDNYYARSYADFSQIDDISKEWEFEHPIIFEKCDYGFRFGNPPDRMVFVPCYTKSDGYYFYDVNIYYNGDLVLRAVDSRDM